MEFQRKAQLKNTFLKIRIRRLGVTHLFPFFGYLKACS